MPDDEAGDDGCGGRATGTGPGDDPAAALLLLGIVPWWSAVAAVDVGSG
ncbi:MAG: hypothetical protein JXB32_24400 [Deltaproteobacteria bacterium]|nr:hypothetical protein [Deltaproteobacteria bacterium]